MPVGRCYERDLTFRTGPDQMPEQLRPRQVLYITLILTFAALLLRFYRVAESMHPDSLLWHDRAQRFWAALADHRFERTNQAPHPGVMLMWITGAVMKLNGTLTGAVDSQGLFALKVPGALVGALSASLTFPLLTACLGKLYWRPALVLAALWTTEPYLIEQSRMAHLDMAALGFAWLGLLVAILAYERDSSRLALGAGALFGMACLTKLSLAPLPATLMLILAGTTAWSRLRDKRGVKVAVLATVAAALTLFALWPAMWLHPIDTIVDTLAATRDLAEHGHGRRVNGRMIRDPGVGFYFRWVAQVTPYETGLLSLFGAVVLGSLRHLRKHYLWLLLSLIPYLVMISLAPKKLSRYALPAAPVLLLLVSAAIEWALPRLREWLQRTPLKRAPLALVAALSLFFVVRFARAGGNLPEAQQCTLWPGVSCTRPSEMYFMHDLALAIRADWLARKQQRTPRVFVGRAQRHSRILAVGQMSPWLKAKTAHSAREADYLIVWDSEYENVDAGTLTRESKKRFGKLGREVVTVTYRGAVVGRAYRARGDD